MIPVSLYSIFTFGLTLVPEFNQFVIGTNKVYPYMPVYLFNGTLQDTPFITHGNNSMVLYRQPTKVLRPIKQYSQLFQLLIHGSNYGRKFLFKSMGQDYAIKVYQGYITDDNDNVLLCLTTKKVMARHLSVDYNDLRLYVSTEFYRKNIYKSLFKRINNGYIEFCYNNGIQVVIVNSDVISKELFSNDFTFKPESFIDISEQINNNVNNLYFTGREVELQPELSGSITVDSTSNTTVLSSYA